MPDGPARFVRCYLCDKMTSVASAGPHREKCMFRWDQRRALPVPPAECGLLNADTPTAVIEAYNAAAADIYNFAVKEPCPKCKKRHEPSKLLRHCQTCMGKNDIRLRRLAKEMAPGGYDALGRTLLKLADSKEASAWSRRQAASRRRGQPA